jgi:hypothetical protein
MSVSLTHRIMPYTLWSKGRLLGHTELDFIANTATAKMGWFHPTEVGEEIIEIITEPSRVVLGYARGVDAEQFRADLTAAGNRVEALELELHDPAGVVLSVEDIGINDTHRLLALAAEHEGEFEDDVIDEELQAAIDHDMEVLRFDDMEDESQPWAEPTEFPRYQILVFM